MAKKLLVSTPVTKDGVTLTYDDQKQVVYKKSIVELAARKGLESLNSNLAEHLRHQFEEIEVEEEPTSSTNEDLKKKLATLEAEKENEELRQRIATLEAEKAEREKADAEAKAKADADAKAKAEAEKASKNDSKK